MLVIKVPYPPSGNRLYRNAGGRGRLKTKEYRAWIDAAGWEVKIQRPHKITGKFRATISCVRPDNRRRDVANLEKAIMDLLVRLQIIEDDSLAQSVTTDWDGSTPGWAEVTITPFERA